MSGMEFRTDGSDADAGDLSDRPVIETPVVPKEKHQTLTLREPGDRRTNDSGVKVRSIRPRRTYRGTAPVTLERGFSTKL
jgi:hypothetical protein